MNLKLLFCGYRSWALDIRDKISDKYKELDILTVSNMSEFTEANQSKYDIIVLAGWSWLIPKNVCISNLVIGLHPSDLPEYSGGSPIQNQILDGIESTYMTLFKITPNLDCGPIFDKKELSLSGDINDIFNNMSSVGFDLISKFIDQIPNVVFYEQSSKNDTHKRLSQKDSKLNCDLINKMTCKQLYNFIRCRTDPYPNAYMEDSTGKIYFKKVEFNE